MAKKETLLIDLARPVVEALGLEFWGLEYKPQGNHSLLRIYIDGPDGITVEHCGEVSRQLGNVMDVEDPISSEYTLEVSSPGMDRPLFTIEQYARYRGHKVSLRLNVAFEGRRKFIGIINGTENDEVLLVIGQDEYCLPIENIDQARIVPQFDD
ncbi:ribosome maturation factor RimP [Oceanospirillum multiglobuliferum]|uniref:Ribosome maturation factor RimP n=1 Tax=Oceanospirillum multiglobuliferum TaxID=64969 RepID=A0A1T4RFG1_9GAMM|nr:ribosome maturation factor RimP [Oceanospirillum multiglobuliferum]OPX54891.1 ribosome maturation factor RimP [Oceanospirillum multiglobuliferum]SKA14732.1 ribosome maturation factor RimP [Oceanospirillum multiglobuliferum]